MIYGHGDDAYRYTIEFKANFSSNIWHEGTSEKILSHLAKKLPLIGNYPAPNADILAKKVANHYQLKPSQVLMTNGATEAFYSIAHLFKGKNAAIGIPTFSEYEDACTSNDIHIRYFNRAEATKTSFDDDDLVFLCNPNNPDGISNTIVEIKKLLIDFPTTTFIIDEAYIDFTFKVTSCVSLLNTFTNLVIIKSLTKLFSIPGLRLGYILCNSKTNNNLQQSKMPWSVNTMAIEAGKHIFNNYETIHPNMSILLECCSQLQQRINSIDGFTVLPSETNYFLVKLDAPKASNLKDYLVHTHQLLIRDASNFRGLDDHYIRIASQSKDKNELLINALQQWSTLQ